MRMLLCFLLISCLLLPLMAVAEEEISLYVAPWGDDDAPGTEDAPLRTLAQAQVLLRRDKTRAPATIWMREGTYRLTEPLHITHRDRKNITIRAYPGEAPVITGDTPVTEWEADVLYGVPVWRAPVKAKEVRALYGEDGARPLARWPKEGMLTVTAPGWETSDMFTNQRAFSVHAKQMPDSMDGAMVRLLHWWKDELSGVKGYDSKTGKVTMNRPSALTPRVGNRVWFENVLTAPMQPGEWAYDAAGGMLYYAPQAGETMESTPLSIGTQVRLLTVDGATGLTLDGLTFARTAWRIPLRDNQTDFPQAAHDVDAALHFKNGKDIAITNCTFSQIGEGCLRFDKNVKDVTITGNTFAEIGAQAVFVRGRNIEDEETNERYVIEDNRIEGYGRNYLNAVAILLIHVRHVDVQHNDIADGTYTAISGGWVWGGGFNITDHLRIENNRIHNIGHGMLSDMGGIYLLGVQRNTVVRGNVIFDVQAEDYGGWGICLDEGASGMLVENNLAFRCSSQGFHQHNGTYNVVRNNIFADNGQGQVGMSDKRKNGGTFRLEGNLLVSRDEFVWYKYDTVRIDIGPNLFYTTVAPYINFDDSLFHIVDDPAYAEVGFTPWEIRAGVRAN